MVSLLFSEMTLLMFLNVIYILESLLWCEEEYVKCPVTVTVMICLGMFHQLLWGLQGAAQLLLGCLDAGRGDGCLDEGLT